MHNTIQLQEQRYAVELFSPRSVLSCLHGSAACEGFLLANLASSSFSLEKGKLSDWAWSRHSVRNLPPLIEPCAANSWLLHVGENEAGSQQS